MKEAKRPKVKKISTRHLYNHGSLGRSIDEFIEIARKIYGDYYGYDRAVYRHSETPIEITCPIHGSFFITPHRFLRGHSCQKCGLESRIQKRTTTFREFMVRFRSLYGRKYQVDESTFVNLKHAVRVICPVHGEFRRTPYDLLRGPCCRQCGGRKPFTRERFLRESTEKHGDAYDYSKVGEIADCEQKVTIICRKHGEFIQSAYHHVLGRGCRKCASDRAAARLTMPFPEFVKKAREIHGDKYQYDEATHGNSGKKMAITCPVHGVFMQCPDNHIGKQRQGCPACGRERISAMQRMPFAEFLRRAREVHGDTYEYDEASFSGSRSKVTIICRKHGPFRQTGGEHLDGHGCRKCRKKTIIRVCP
jgi:hypothetical protein